MGHRNSKKWVNPSWKQEAGSVSVWPRQCALQPVPIMWYIRGLKGGSENRRCWKRCCLLSGCSHAGIPPKHLFAWALMEEGRVFLWPWVQHSSDNNQSCAWFPECSPFLLFSCCVVAQRDVCRERRPLWMILCVSVLNACITPSQLLAGTGGEEGTLAAMPWAWVLDAAAGVLGAVGELPAPGSEALLGAQGCSSVCSAPGDSSCCMKDGCEPWTLGKCLKMYSLIQRRNT